MNLVCFDWAEPVPQIKDKFITRKTNICCIDPGRNIVAEVFQMQYSDYIKYYFWVMNKQDPQPSQSASSLEEARQRATELLISTGYKILDNRLRVMI